jgi:hypothetical protein
VKSVGEVNDKGLPMDKATSSRLSRVCGFTAWQRVPLTLDTFDDQSDNDMKELFDNYVQDYVEYPEELKKKGKKIAMKINLSCLDDLQE